MRFIHIADVHLGAAPDAGNAYSPKREQEIWNSFGAVTEECRVRQAEALFIAGDLFHRQPLLRELKEVNSLFEQIPNTHVFMIAGNHDYLKKDSYYRTFPWAANVHMITSQEISCIEIETVGLAVYGCSYYSREMLAGIYDTAIPESRQTYEILLAHGGDDKHIPIQRNKLKTLGYDYIALGHIHKPQKIADIAAYSGALEPIDKNDTGTHGYLYGELTPKGLKLDFVPCAIREYIHQEVAVSDTMTNYVLKKQISQLIEEQGIQNIYKIILTGFRDPDVCYSLDDMDTYGNIIEIVDGTQPAYDFDKLHKENSDNLIGKFIQALKDNDQKSVEYYALCEGIQALIETRRG